MPSAAAQPSTHKHAFQRSLLPHMTDAQAHGSTDVVEVSSVPDVFHKIGLTYLPPEQREL